MSFSKLFCRHIWKETSSEYLRWRREQDGGIGMLGLPTYSNYEYRAARKVCLKCGRKRIESYRVNWGRLTPRALDAAPIESDEE